jgi:hypothetical protein
MTHCKNIPFQVGEEPLIFKIIAKFDQISFINSVKIGNRIVEVKNQLIAYRILRINRVSQKNPSK